MNPAAAASIIREVTGPEGEGEQVDQHQQGGEEVATALELLNAKVEDPYTMDSIQHTTQKVVSHNIDLRTHQQLAASL